MMGFPSFNSITLIWFDSVSGRVYYKHKQSIRN